MRIPVEETLSRDHHKRVVAEMNRLVREAVAAVGGYITNENLVVVPNRPKYWRPTEWPTLAVMHESYISPENHVRVIDTALRDKVAMFLANHEPMRTNVAGGVLVLCPAQ